MIPAPLLLVAKPALDFLKGIPWWVWAILAAVAFHFWDRGVYARDQVAKNDAMHEERAKQAAAAHAAKVAQLRGQISDWVLQGIKWRDEGAAKLRAEMNAHDLTFDQLKKQRPIYVTPAAVARCDLTRGVILQFNAGAAAANGEAHPAGPPDPGAGALDASSEVPLDTYAAAVEETQRSLGACRIQVTGWQQHWASVTTWYDGLRAKVNECFPQPTKEPQ